MTTPLMIACDEQAAADLLQFFEERLISAQASQRRNLDGSEVTSWFVVAALAIQAAPAILREFTRLLSRNQIEEISYGEIKISKPRPEDVTRIIDRLPLPKDGPKEG